MQNVRDLLVIKAHTLATKEEVESVQKDITDGTKKLTAAEVGELRRKFFTREYPRVKECGHPFLPSHVPHSNCEHCWFAYFTDSQELMKRTLEVLKEVGEDGGLKALTNIHGVKWVKHFRRFIATIIALQQMNQRSMNALTNRNNEEAA